VNTDLDPASPNLTGQRVVLDGVQPQDYAFLHRLAVHPETGFRWRFRGATPGPEEFNRGLWNQVTAQFVISERATKRQVGVVTSYGTNLRDGWTYVALCGDPDVDRRGLGVEALGVFLEYLFTMWNFHKVYFEIPAFNFKRLAPSISDYFTQEGTLHDHLFYGGRRWDMYIYSVTRTRWSYLARSNDVVQFGLGRRRHNGEHDEGTLGIDAFVSLVAKSLEIDSPMTPDATWRSSVWTPSGWFNRRRSLTK
jgi:RimJ/RimL family protein N-acetyltransferase